jgi:hypothetical protein
MVAPVRGAYGLVASSPCLAPGRALSARTVAFDYPIAAASRLLHGPGSALSSSQSGSGNARGRFACAGTRCSRCPSAYSPFGARLLGVGGLTSSRRVEACACSDSLAR